MADELGAERPSDDELRDLCQRVAAISGELFSNEWTVKVTRDPEIPGDVFFVFRVVATGNVDDIVARSNQWHIAVRRVIGSRAELFCLSFDVREGIRSISLPWRSGCRTAATKQICALP
ncbi:MAG TPA: hypothetical protein VFW87_24760 [Pirellulales bacterium]|nr:hypothetical protein [Pirellulales bacterium]